MITPEQQALINTWNSHLPFSPSRPDVVWLAHASLAYIESNCSEPALAISLLRFALAICEKSGLNNHLLVRELGGDFHFLMPNILSWLYHQEAKLKKKKPLEVRDWLTHEEICFLDRLI